MIKVEQLQEGDSLAGVGNIRQIIWRDDIGKFSVWFAGDGWWNFEPGHEFPMVWRNGKRHEQM